MMDVILSKDGKHYQLRWVDMIPIVGFVPHFRRTREYMEGIKEGEYCFPENAASESLKRFGITAYHGIIAGVTLCAGLEKNF